MFEPTPKQFGVFWEFIENPTVTDIDYNGRELWITDLKKGKYKKNKSIVLMPIDPDAFRFKKPEE